MIFKALLSLIIIASFPLHASGEVTFFIDKAVDRELHKHHQWKILLHFKGGKSAIKSNSFFLSPNGRTSPKDELLASISAFLQPNTHPSSHAICRFPARFHWLKKHLKLNRKTADPVCPELEKFKRSVPVDEIALIFASENISSPASVMGHSILKLSGIDEHGTQRQHAFSYFTLFDTLNPLSIGYRAFFSGLPGRYSLSPYKKVVTNYLTHENRNIWEYKLKLSNETKKTLSLHLWELKNKESRYKYTTYNCATVLHQFLRFEKNSLQGTNKLWVAPIDLVHTVRDENLIESVKLLSPPQWKLRLLLELIKDSKTKDDIIDLTKAHKPEKIMQLENELDKALALNMYSEHAKYEYSQKKIAKDEYVNLTTQINSLSEKINRVDFSLENYKSPTNTPPLNRLSIGLGSKAVIDWQPVSTKLEDDHRNYFSEYQTSILNVIASYDLKTEELSLDKLDLYSVESILPSDGLTRSVSGRFRFGSNRAYNINLRKKLYTGLEGAIGYASSLHNNDVIPYVLIGSEIAYAKHGSKLRAYPEFGIILREILNMKSIFSYRRSYEVDYKSEHGHLDISNIKQSLYLNNRNALILDVEHTKSYSSQKTEWSLNYVYKF